MLVILGGGNSPSVTYMFISSFLYIFQFGLLAVLLAGLLHELFVKCSYLFQIVLVLQITFSSLLSTSWILNGIFY